MSKVISLAFVLVAIAVGRDSYGLGGGPDLWKSKIFVAEMMSVLFFSYIIWRRVHWSASLAWASSVGSCLWVFGLLTPYTRLNQTFDHTGFYGYIGEIAFQSQGLDSAVFILLITLPFLFASRRHRAAVRDGIGWFCLADAVFVVGQWAFGVPADGRGGFTGNPSMNACIIAICYPLMDIGALTAWITRLTPRMAGHWVRVALSHVCFFGPPLAVILSHSSMGVGVLCVVFAAIAFGSMRYKTAIIASLTMWVVILVPSYFYFRSGRGLFHDSDRLVIWQSVYYWWEAFGPFWFGTGEGTAQLWIPRIHHLAGIAKNSSWYFLHCDWFQLQLEQGLVGIAAFTTLFVTTCSRALKTAKIEQFAAACALAAASLGNFPFRFAVPAIVSVYIVAEVFGTSLKSDSRRKLNQWT